MKVSLSIRAQDMNFALNGARLSFTSSALSDNIIINTAIPLFYSIFLSVEKKKPQYYYALIQNEFLCRNGFFVFMAEAVCILCF